MRALFAPGPLAGSEYSVSAFSLIGRPARRVHFPARREIGLPAKLPPRGLQLRSSLPFLSLIILLGSARPRNKAPRFALQTPDGLFALDSSQLTLRNKPALAPYRTQNATLGDFLSEAFQERLLGFVRSQDHGCHYSFTSLLSSSILDNSSAASGHPRSRRSRSGSKDVTRTLMVSPCDRTANPSVDFNRPSIPRSNRT